MTAEQRGTSGARANWLLTEDWHVRRAHLGVRNPALVLSELLRLVFDLDEPLDVVGCPRGTPVRAVVDEALDLIYSAPTVAHSWEPPVAIATIGATCEVLRAGRVLLCGEEALSRHMPGLEQLVDPVVQGRMWHVDRHGRILASMGGSPQAPWPARVRPINLGTESEIVADLASGLERATYWFRELLAELALYEPGDGDGGVLPEACRAVERVLATVRQDLRQIGPRHFDVGTAGRSACFALAGALTKLSVALELYVNEDLTIAVEQAWLASVRIADYPSLVVRPSPRATPE